MPNRPILIRTTDELREKAERKAARLGLNLSSYIRMLMVLDLEKDLEKE